MCLSLSSVHAHSVAASLSQVYRFAIINNVRVLYVGVCVGVPQAFVRILGGCVLTSCYLVQASARNRPQHVVCGSKYTADNIVKGRSPCANFSFRAFSLSHSLSESLSSFLNSSNGTADYT